ncbi:SURF1 family protein [Sinorhizobium sp. BG8]|nr:SURF1 family protein [Sinorhizobium sp. BG8]
MQSPRRFRALVSGAVVLAALAVLVSLGTWQLQRLHWKERLLSEIAGRRTAAAVSLSELEKLAADGEDIDYRPVTAQGTYVNDGERHFFATWNGQSGYYVYTPLALENGRFVLVNRGFVPYEKKKPETRVEGQLSGPQTVTGLGRGRLEGKPSWVVPDNDLAGNIFYWKDLDAMASSAGIPASSLVPFFIDADDTPNPGGLPVGGVTQFDLPNNHLQYALTWYGLAVTLVLVSGLYVLRRKD